jgi:hypothetical protein
MSLAVLFINLPAEPVLSVRVASMSSLVDSAAVFRSRCKQLQIPDAVVLAMEAKGWSTIGLFAYSTSYVPGAPDDSAFKKDVLEAVLGQASAPGAAAIRRLFYEAFSMAAAEVRAKSERSDEGPKKIPVPERNARFQRLVLLLPDHEITRARRAA